ncbi:NIPSNAP family protein [Streptomyces sp. NPDC102406]|uniref:NIPSNAP family protein n=1 Tax=Streptomyces sp. NPDC102406 TaxID=3366171 RepID=UPI003827A5ED
MRLLDRHGGTHHGYFLPAEGAGDLALARFGFPSLAAYEQYRARYERTFMRPLLPDSSAPSDGDTRP